MGFDLPVFISAGIQDALSPMPLAVAGIYALMMLFLRYSRKPAPFISAGLFVGVLVVSGVLFDLKLFDPLSPMPVFLNHPAWGILALGLVLLAFGFLFFREWRILVPEASRKFAAFIPTPGMGAAAAAVLSCFLAAGFAVLSSIWPVNFQVLIQSDMAFTPGRFFYSLGAIFVYEIFRNIAALFVLLLFVLAHRERNASFLRRKRSLVLIIASAFYIAVGGALLFFFFVAATK